MDVFCLWECLREIPKDAPAPKGKLARTTTFVDATLMYCKVTGKSATGVIHLLNQTPVDTFSKKQSTVETATYGSEFVAAKHATEQIIAMRLTLRYMGVPLEKEAWLLGDNQSIIMSFMLLHLQLNKHQQKRLEKQWNMVLLLVK